MNRLGVFLLGFLTGAAAIALFTRLQDEKESSFESLEESIEDRLDWLEQHAATDISPN